jgi:alpha-glucosidase
LEERMNLGTKIFICGCLLACLAPVPSSLVAEERVPEENGIAVLEFAEHSPSGVLLKATLKDGTTVPVRIDVVSRCIVRVRVNQGGVFEPTLAEKDGFIKSDWSRTDFDLKQSRGEVAVTVGKLTVKIQNKPAEISFYQSGNLLTHSVAGRLAAFKKGSTLIAFSSPEDEQFFGFSDQGRQHFHPDSAPLNHRGQSIPMTSLSHYRVYYAPFFMSSRGYGFFLNTLVESDWDMAKTHKDSYSIGVDETQLDFYIIAGGSFKEILSAYTELVGRPPLMPLWEFGGRAEAQKIGFVREETLASNEPVFATSGEGDDKVRPDGWNTRWLDEKIILAHANDIRDKHIPCDYYHFDSHWQTIRNSFDWVSEVSDPKGLMESLNKLHFKVGLWQRPTLVAFDYPLYREAQQRGFLVKGEDGRTFVCPYKYGGPSAMVDFTNPSAVRWWQDKVRELTTFGARTFKLDSASSGFIVAYPEARHARFSNGLTGREMENYYGPLYVKTVWDALRSGLNGKRAVLHIYHQLYFAGGRYPFSGLGDRTNRTDAAIRTRIALNYGLSGIPFWQAGEITPFGLPLDDFELQVRMIPYTYTYWREAHDKGLPLIRSMFLEYEDDPETFRVDSQFLFGREFLVVPSLKGSEEWLKAYLPQGEWVDYRSKEKYQGPGWTFVRRGDKKAAVLVRGGSIIPLGPPMEYTEARPAGPMTLEVFPSGESSFEMYEDDGDTYEYEGGAFGKTKFSCREFENRIEIEIGPTSGNYAGMPTKRVYNVVVYGTTCPKQVVLDGEILQPYEDKDRFEKTDTGWFYEMRGESGFNRSLLVRLPAKDIRRSSALELQESKSLHYYF